MDVIGRGWLRCSTWTIGVRSLLRFGPFAPGTPSSSRGPHVRSVAPMYAAIPLFPLFWTGETGKFWGCNRGKVHVFVIANFAPEPEAYHRIKIFYAFTSPKVSEDISV